MKKILQFVKFIKIFKYNYHNHTTKKRKTNKIISYTHIFVSKLNMIVNYYCDDLKTVSKYELDCN